MSAADRRSFREDIARGLLISVMFYAAAATVLFGDVMMRYQIAVGLSFPLIAWLTALYCDLAGEPHGVPQQRQHLDTRQSFMVAVLICTVGIILLFCIDLATFINRFSFTVPVEASP